MGVFDDPGSRLLAVTPNDTTDLTGARAVYVGAGGNVALMSIDDAAAVTFAGVPAGSIIPVRIRRVMSTNTTASDIVAIF